MITGKQACILTDEGMTNFFEILCSVVQCSVLHILSSCVITGLNIQKK